MKKIIEKVMNIGNKKIDKNNNNNNNVFKNVDFIKEVNDLNPIKFSNDIYSFINETNKF